MFAAECMESFEQLLAESTRIHGHICAGQVIGVRMSMAALARIGITDPKGADRKKLYVLVEIDRCATDAIQSVTGCSLGKRSLRWLDFGVMAATFVHLETGRAVRVTAREEARALSEAYCPEVVDKYQRQLEAYKVMPLDDLFVFQEVRVAVRDCDMPGVRFAGCSAGNAVIGSRTAAKWSRTVRPFAGPAPVIAIIRCCPGRTGSRPVPLPPEKSGARRSSH